jgi:capsular exopolysaccharide synthesis family protein
MGIFSDALEKYENEQHQQSTRVAEHKAALTDDTQPQSASPQPADTPTSPAIKAATAPVSPETPTYKFQLKPPPPKPKETPPISTIETKQPTNRLNKPAHEKLISCVGDCGLDPGLISILDPFSLQTDLFKTLRGKILFPVSGEPPRSLMVTSAVPGEGKTYIASNLAVNVALNIAEYVLLVDCDLRRPRLHKMFGFDQVKGLSDHLANGTELYDLLHKTVVDKLTLLPAGTPPLNPSEILSSAKMANLIDEVKSRYDDRYLIIDSPPPMLAPETSAIAKRVDGIIIVIKYGETPLKLIEQMMESLNKEKIIGAVINRFDTHTSGNYGYKKYRRHYQT